MSRSEAEGENKRRQGHRQRNRSDDWLQNFPLMRSVVKGQSVERQCQRQISGLQVPEWGWSIRGGKLGRWNMLN